MNLSLAVEFILQTLYGLDESFKEDTWKVRLSNNFIIEQMPLR